MRGRLPAWLAFCIVAACNGQSGQVDDFGGMGVLEVPARRGSIVVVSCSLDGGQRAALESSAVKKLAQDVVFLCFGIDSLGQAQPAGAESRQAFAKEAEWVSRLGYRAKVGISLGDPALVSGRPGPAARFASASFRTKVASSVLEVAGYGVGIELDLRHLPDVASGDLTEVVSQISKAVRPHETLGVLVPADGQQGDAVDVEGLAVLVDRVRVMTLDYSLGRGPGPTIDSGWAVDSARHALAAAGQTPIDVAVPLYGWDFNPSGPSAITCPQAWLLQQKQGATLERALSGAPWFSFSGARGNEEQVWFDDAQSTVLTLAAWPEAVLPAGVGVVFFDLGAEDPGVWKAIEEAAP
jgi:hypothetical protein